MQERGRNRWWGDLGRPLLARVASLRFGHAQHNTTHTFAHLSAGTSGHKSNRGQNRRHRTTQDTRTGDETTSRERGRGKLARTRDRERARLRVCHPAYYVFDHVRQKTKDMMIKKLHKKRARTKILPRVFSSFSPLSLLSLSVLDCTRFHSPPLDCLRYAPCKRGSPVPAFVLPPTTNNQLAGCRTHFLRLGTSWLIFSVLLEVGGGRVQFRYFFVSGGAKIFESGTDSDKE